MNASTIFRIGIGPLLLITSLQSGPLNDVNAGDWRQFRGPQGGIATDSRHPRTWGETSGDSEGAAEEKMSNIRWKVPVAGVGWSQPIIHGSRVYVTTAVAANQPKPKTGERGPGFSFFSAEGLSRSLLGGGEPPEDEYTWKLFCFDLQNGDEVFCKDIHQGRPAIPVHRSNSYASETPVCDDQRLYVYVSAVGLFCFDLDGQPHWQQDFEPFSTQYGWGCGSSPVLLDDRILIQCDNDDQSFVAAYAKATGDQLWKVDREERSNWSTPHVWRYSTADGHQTTELVTCGGTKYRSYNAETGKLLWDLPADGRCATTAVSDNSILVVGSVSRSMGASGRLIGIRPNASGSLSIEKDATSESIAWVQRSAAPEIASPLLTDGRIYTLSQQGGIVCCFDAKTGERIFRERLPAAGGFTASPWRSGDEVFCLDENGQTFVLPANGKFEVRLTNRLAGMFWSSAAITDDELILRSVDHLYCIVDQSSSTD